MRHICIILHGIEVNPSDVCWSEELAWRMAAQVDGRIEFYPRKYGYVGGWRTIINWGDLATGKSYREIIVDHEAEFFNKLRADVGPDAKISVICHSLGGYIVHQLLDRGFIFHRIIELYGAGNEHQDWSIVERHFDAIYIWYSSRDEILPQSNYGRIGLVGPRREHPRVFKILTQDHHNDFQDDALMYARIPIWINELED